MSEGMVATDVGTAPSGVRKRKARKLAEQGQLSVSLRPRRKARVDVAK